MTAPSSNNSPNSRVRRGVIGIILRGENFLVIRRSAKVTAPGLLCFAGGGIEEGESESDALVREMMEELSLDIVPVECVWRSVTSWGTQLAWWTASIGTDAHPVANPDEVAEVMWMNHAELREASKILPSMPKFLDAWCEGELTLPISPV